MTILGKKTSEYVRFVRTGMILIVLMGLIRFGVGIWGVPYERATHFVSVTILTLLLFVVYGYKAASSGFGTYRHLLPVAFALAASMYGFIVLAILTEGLTGLHGYFHVHTLHAFNDNLPPEMKGMVSPFMNVPTHIGGQLLVMVPTTLLGWGLSSLGFFVSRRINGVKTIGPLLVLAIVLVPHPAFAQVDLSGEWSNLTHEDLTHRQSVELGDYTGLPINEASRFKAESWDAAVLSTHERQCIPHVVTYAMRGMPGNIRISKVDNTDTGQIIAYTIHGTYGRPRTVWMDGRPHPSQYAPHSWAGFSTGKWEGNALVVTTTHIKMGWIMRNGVPTSDRATMTEHFIRHGNHLMDVIVVVDPVYLSEPFIRTQDWLLNLGGQPNAYGVCGPAQIIDELANRKSGYVPHYLPGMNQDLREFPVKRGIPANAAGGGAETTYPEYSLQLQGRTGRAAAAPTPNPVQPSDVPGDIQVLPVQGNVYLLAGAGGNSAIQVGDDGILLVDTGAGPVSDKVLAAIRQLSSKPIRIVINTNADSDHTGGNEILAKSGSRIGGGVLVGGRAEEGAMVIAHEQVLAAMSAPTGKVSPTPARAWPTDTYFGDSKDVYANGEGIQILHQPAAHTDGDSLIYFRRSDVIVTGDIFNTTGYPVINAERPGSFSAVLDGLNRIIDLAIPKDWQEGGTMVIPGHGRIAEESDVVEYRDMLTIIRDRFQDMIGKGMTLDQVKAARPTRDYDGRYGTATGPWTTDSFIEAVYRDLSRRGTQ